jgi:hypothetical protein
MRAILLWVSISACCARARLRSLFANRSVIAIDDQREKTRRGLHFLPQHLSGRIHFGIGDAIFVVRDIALHTL